MKILHYSLGFPPYRSGGLTKFCMDLMLYQRSQGHSVSLLWPGTMIGSNPHILKKRPVDGLDSYELINPLPVSYDEGIIEVDYFTETVSPDVFVRYLKKLHPDVIHIHTFMGLYDAFLDAAKSLGIKTVFTAHDFFPICPKVTLFRNGENCDCASTCSSCPECNATALSMNKMQILQSPFYRAMKDSKLVRAARKQHRENYSSDSLKTRPTDKTAEDYLNLRSYYYRMLQKVDVIHFNSQITKNTYELYFVDVLESVVIPVSHSHIKDCRKVKGFNCNPLRIRYLGPVSAPKGYYLLKAALDELWCNNHNFVLDLHVSPENTSPYMQVHDRYKHSDLSEIFEDTDVLIAPSIWHETFGFTVLEAISYGVPAIISGTVGARDILVNGTAIVIDDISKESLKDVISSLTPARLKDMNEAIVSNQEIVTLDHVADRIMEECYLG